MHTVRVAGEGVGVGGANEEEGFLEVLVLPSHCSHLLIFC